MNPARTSAAALAGLAAACAVTFTVALTPETAAAQTPMKLQSLTPNVMVDDMDQTIAFYRDVLGFALVTSVPEAAPYDWAMLQRDDVAIMLQTRASLGGEYTPLRDHPTGGALTFFVKMEGINAFYEQVRPHVTLVNDLNDTFYGMREFSVRDPNGFVITFAEPVK